MFLNDGLFPWLKMNDITPMKINKWYGYLSIRHISHGAILKIYWSIKTIIITTVETARLILIRFIVNKQYTVSLKTLK